ncbi:MAG: hypothetical protein OXP66_15135, partial [Candidatus Tectomicrobia bacterium]|nr:hypothetical protein [Candidatus Tectomicrobia bacterium]
MVEEQEACPLPAGEAPPADPAVIAQQVEDGSATLAEFAEAALLYYFDSPAHDTDSAQIPKVGFAREFV